MELLLMLMLMTATAVTAGPPVQQHMETTYMDGKEYIYKYESQVLTGLPLGSKIYSGLKVKGHIRIQKIGYLETKMELKEPTLYKVIGPVDQQDPTREMLPDEAMVEMLDKDAEIMKSMLIKPVKFLYLRGHVEDVVIERDDPVWSVNIKKGALSLLEINFNERHSLSHDVDVDSIEPIPKLYKVIEGSVSGECETTYKLRTDVSRESTASMEMVKVRDLNRCIDKVITTSTVVNGMPCDKISEVLSAQASVRYSLLGSPSMHIILSAVGESQYSLVTHTEKQGRMATMALQTLVLIDSRPITDQIYDPKSPILQDQPLTVKTSAPRPSMNEIEMVQKVLSGLDPLMKNKVEEEVTDLIKTLHRLLQMLDKTGLEAIVEYIDKDSAKPRARKVLFDTLPTVGTHAAVDVLLNRLESKPNSPLATSVSLMTLGLLPEPDIPIVKRVMDYVEKVDSSDALVKRAAYLCLGALGNKLVKKNYTDITELKKQENILKLLREESNERKLRMKLDKKLDQLKDYLIQKEKLYTTAKEKIIKMVETLYKAKDEASKLLALKTIRNLAFPDFLDKLESVLTDRAMPLTHRMVALVGLKQLAKSYPDKVYKVLLPLVYDRTEEEELRGLAIMIAMTTELPRPDLEMLVKSLTTEPSSHIRALVTSVLTQMSNSTSPCNCLKSMIHNSTLALRFAHEPAPGIHKSNMIHKALYDKDLEMGQVYDQVMLYSSKEKLPRAIAVTLASIYEGKSANVLEFGYMAEGMDGIMDKVMGDPSIGGVAQMVRKLLHPRHARSTSQPKHDIQDIKEKLEVKPRVTPPLKGNIFLSMYGYELMYLDADQLILKKKLKKDDEKPVSSSVLQSLEKKISPLLPDITGMLDILKSLLDQQASVVLPLHQAHLPTETGLPLMLDTVTLGVVKMDGDLDVKMDPKLANKKSLLSKFDSFLKIRISGVLECTTNFVTKMDTIKSGLYVKSKVDVDLPMSSTINMDPDKDKLLIKLTDQKKLQPMKIVMTPTAFIHKMPKKAADFPSPPEDVGITVIDGAELKTFAYDYGKEYLGRKLSVVGQRAVRRDTGVALPSISGTQIIRVVYDPKALTDLDIQLQHVRVKPDDLTKGDNSPKSSWWPFNWLLAPSDTAPPKYDGKEPKVEIPEEKPVKGFINLEDEDLTIMYLKSKFSKDTDILKSGDKCGMVVRMMDPDPSSKHDLQLSTLFQMDETSHKYLYAIELRRKPILDETKDWKMVTSMKVDLPVTEVEPSDLEDNEYQHEVEKQIQEIIGEPKHSIELKSKLLMEVIKEQEEYDSKTSPYKLLENIISTILDREVDGSIEYLKELVQEQRKLLKDIVSMDKQEMTIEKKKSIFKYLLTTLEKSKYISSELDKTLDRVMAGQQKPEEAVLVLYILTKQKKAEKMLYNMKEKLQPLLSLDEKIDAEKTLVDLVKEYYRLREKQEQHSLKKQPTEKDKAILEIDPKDRMIHRDLMHLERNLISVMVKPMSTVTDPTEEKKIILEAYTKLETTVKYMKKITDQLDDKLEKKVYIGKMLQMKIVEILLHQHLIVLDLSHSKLIDKISQHEKAMQHSLLNQKDIDIKALMQNQETVIHHSKKILKRLLIAVDATKDLRSLVSLTTPDEQRHLEYLQKLKLKQLIVLEYLEEISPDKYIPTPKQHELQGYFIKIKDIGKDLHDIIVYHHSIKYYEGSVLSPVVMRGLNALSRHLEIIGKISNIIGKTLLKKSMLQDSDVEKYYTMKNEAMELKFAVLREIGAVEELYLDDVARPDHKEPVTVPELLRKSVMVEAKRLRLKPVMAEVLGELDKPVDLKPPVEDVVRKQKLLYDAISQILDIQTELDTLGQVIYDQVKDLPRDGSVTDLLKILEKKQKHHVKLIKHLEDKLKHKAAQDTSLYPAVKEVQKIKDKAQRQELKMNEIKQAHKKTVKGTGPEKLLHSARNTLPQQLLNKPLKASVYIAYGPEDGKRKHIEILFLGQKSLEQLYWEKDQSLPDRQDPLVSGYHQDKLVTDDRTALGYTYMKDELNTYRHLHVLCSYEASLPVGVRLLAWKSHELIKLLYYKKVTLVMPDTTNIPNKLDISIDIKKDDRMLDMEIRTPYETNVFKHVEEPSFCKLAAIPKSRVVKDTIIHTLTGTSPKATCEVSKDRIKSLQGTRYQLMTEAEPCEHVLAMDCSSSDRLVITGKPVHSMPGKKILNIITLEHKIEITPHTSDIQVEVDEAKTDLKEPVIIKGKLSVHKLYDSSVEVKIYDIGVSVLTDGEKTSIKVSKVLGPRLCGLCGELTYGIGSDLRDPHQVSYHQPESLVSTYLIPDTVCDAKAIQKKYQVPEIRKIAKRVYPVDRTKVLELKKDNKICFSTTPVKHCPGKSQPDSLKSVQVSFHCLRSGNAKVPVYKKLAKTQVIRELQYKRVSIQTYVHEPVDCVTE